MPAELTPCPACGSPCRLYAGEEGAQSVEAVGSCPDEQAAFRCSVCGGENREQRIRALAPERLAFLLGVVPNLQMVVAMLYEDERFLATRLETERVGRQAAEGERDRLRAALRPFADHADAYDQAGAGSLTDADVDGVAGHWLRIGDFRRARAALAGEEGEEDAD